MGWRILLHITWFLTIFSAVAYAAMTEAQLQGAVKLVRKMCQSRHKTTDEEIDKMHRGDWNIDRSAMCYMHCALASNNLITKENLPNFEMAISLATKNLPAARKDPTIASINECKDSVKTPDDKCAAAYELSKCFYDSNPENYFLP